VCSLEKTMTCELSFLPIQAEDYSSEVKKVLSMIKNSGLEHIVGDMSTTVRGDPQTVWSLVEAIYDSMFTQCRFVLDIRVSNVCGCN
jgi:uncharacterized protein YqgV (UPF0045/DUF77 family)